MTSRSRVGTRILGAVLMAGAAWAVWGCGFNADQAGIFGPIFNDRVGGFGPGGVSGGSGGFDQGSGGVTNPCNEPNTRKFVTISMRNHAPFDHIHYFFAMVAFIDDGTGSRGAVCPEDVGIYTDFGYQLIPEGTNRSFGDYCIQGPALLYFHRNGAFRGPGGLGSAIAPAQGNNPTFDQFFNSAGARVPVPNQILWHNPGVGEGLALQVAQLNPDPCNTTIISGGTSRCNQDAFYYVDENDLLSGTTALGAGSGRRVPSEIQGTQCGAGVQNAASLLAATAVTSSTAASFNFVRGGRIEYAFVNENTNPPIPQLVWRVTDAGGGVIHAFDPRVPLD